MKAVFRINRALLDLVHEDLSRPHGFAHERVGFIACKVAALQDGHLVLAESYNPVHDDDYEDDPTVGAMMGPGAIRKALQFAYHHPVGMFHVHRHEHKGQPGFSRTDVRESAKFIPDFWKVRPSTPHGAIVLSYDAIAGAWWDPATRQAQTIDEFAILGRRLWLWGRES